MENVDKTKCPRCKESYADGMVKIFGRPSELKEALNPVEQCLHCKFIFSWLKD